MNHLEGRVIRVLNSEEPLVFSPEFEANAAGILAQGRAGYRGGLRYSLGAVYKKWRRMCPQLEWLRKTEFRFFNGMGYQKRRNQKAEGNFFRLFLAKRRKSFQPFRLWINHTKNEQRACGLRGRRCACCT